MKRVLLFYTSEICHGILHVSNEKIEDCLKKRGIQCDTLDLRKPENEVIHELERLLIKGYDAAIAFNQTEIHNIILPNDESIFDHYDVPFYNYIVDSPWGYTAYTESKCKNYNLFCVDLDHVDQVEKYCNEVKSVHFLPLGGMSGVEEARVFEDRPIDLIYYAGYEKKTLSEMLEYFKSLPDPYPVLLLNMIDYMMANKSANEEEALRNVLKDVFRIEEVDKHQYKKLLVAITETVLFMRSYIREEVVRKLVRSSVSMHLFGEGWVKRVGQGSGKTVFHGGFSYSQLSGLLNQSKIILNVFPWFKNGTNERICSGALHKTVIMTDYSKYIDTLPKGLLFQFDINHISELPDYIESILLKPQDMYQVSERMYEYATRNMTWECTIDRMVEIIEQEKENVWVDNR